MNILGLAKAASFLNHLLQRILSYENDFKCGQEFTDGTKIEILLLYWKPWKEFKK